MSRIFFCTLVFCAFSNASIAVHWKNLFRIELRESPAKREHDLIQQFSYSFALALGYAGSQKLIQYAKNNGITDLQAYAGTSLALLIPAGLIQKDTLLERVAISSGVSVAITGPSGGAGSWLAHHEHPMPESVPNRIAMASLLALTYHLGPTTGSHFAKNVISDVAIISTYALSDELRHWLVLPVPNEAMQIFANSVFQTVIARMVHSKSVFGSIVAETLFQAQAEFLARIVYKAALSKASVENAAAAAGGLALSYISLANHWGKASARHSLIAGIIMPLGFLAVDGLKNTLQPT